MRKYYIDNIRILCIFMLFPFHAAMIYNDFGEVWYLKGVPSRAASMLNLAVYPWWMSLLFVIAGMSAVYSLKNRTAWQYIKERFLKLQIPLISALLLIIPVQSYIADIFYNNYSGSYLSHFKEFFMLTDWSGSDGHFTPGHTWFIHYLFMISMITLPIALWYQKKEKKFNVGKLNVMMLIPFFILPCLSKYILNIGGKSIGEFTAYFLLGYFILSDDEVQDRLQKNCIPLGVAWFVLMVLRCTMYQPNFRGNIIWEIERGLFAWIGILAAIGLGKRFLEFNNGFTRYFSPAAFPLFFFHQSVIVVVGYYILQMISIPVIQYVAIIAISFVITLLIYEITRRTPPTRFLFGIKKPNKYQDTKLASRNQTSN